MKCHSPLAHQPAAFSATPALSAAVLAICLGSGGVAAATASDVSVTIFADHYV